MFLWLKTNIWQNYIFSIAFCCSFFSISNAQTCNTPPAPNDANWFGLQANPGGPLASGVLVSDYSSNGEIYIGGNIEAELRIAKWDGTDWIQLGQKLYNENLSYAEIYALEVDANGDVYVGGLFNRARNSVGGTPVVVSNIARWNASAELWEPVGEGTDFTIYSIAIDGDKIYVGGGNGNGINSGGSQVPLNRIGYWDNLIDEWKPVGMGVDIGEVKLIGVDAAGSVFICGSFSNAINTGGGSVAAERIAKWDGASWSPLGEGLTGINSYRGGIVFDNNNEMIIGSDFTSAVNSGGGSVPGPVARWDGSQWTSLNAASPGFVFDLDRDGFGNIYLLYLNSGFNASEIDKHDGSGWISFAEAAGKYIQTISGDPGSFSQRLYAGGLFNSLFYPVIGVTLDITNNALFDGLIWRKLIGAGGSNGVISALETLQCGNGSCLLYVGGAFTDISGIPASNIATFDGSYWGEMGKGVSGPVYDIDRNKSSFISWVVVGGNFSEALEIDSTIVTVNNVALFNGSWVPLGKGVNGPVHAVLCKLNYFNQTVSGSIIVAGNFTQATNPDYSTVTVNSVARWDWETEQWYSVGEGITGGTGEVFAITEGLSVSVPVTEPNFYLGGSFSGAINTGGQVVNSSNIIYYNNDTDMWEPVGQGVDDIVKALALGPFVPQVPLDEQLRVFVGGELQNSINPNGSTVSTPYISLWDDFNENWIPVRGGLNGVINTIDNTGLIGGEFTTAYYENGASRQMNHIGKIDLFNPETWEPMGFNAINDIVNAAISVGWCRVSGENIFAGGEFSSAGYRNAKNLARWIYRYQACNTIINVSSSSSGGGGGTGGSVGVLMNGPTCSDLMSNPFLVEETLFDSLGFRESLYIDSLFNRQYFSLTIHPAGDPNNPIVQLDSLYNNSDNPGTYVFLGVEDTTLFAPNPDGRSIGMNVLISSYDFNTIQSGNVEVIFTNAVTDAPEVDISIQGGANLVSGFPYGTSSPQVSLPPDNYTFEVTRSSNGQLIGTYSADLTGHTEEFVTLLLSGFVDPSSNQNGPPFSMEKYESGVSTIIVGVDDENKNQLVPAEFSLSQNYPNPFNPTTKIRFTVDKTERTELIIYDVLGQRVSTLFSDVAFIGKQYEIDFNAGKLASGIYLGILKSKTKRESIKMILIK